MPHLQLIQVGDVLREVNDKLLALLKSLEPDEWHLPTTARSWTVKDVAAHLLDGNLRTLSILRDGYSGDPPGAIGSYADLVKYLDRLNADWVRATRRLSPAVLISMLESTGMAFCDYIDSLDPSATAVFSVAWAGENRSPNWFHVAREYTEKWHHQQQIRLATGRGYDDLFTKKLFTPLIDTLLRALPHHYRDVPGEAGEVLRVSITGEGGGEWYLSWKRGTWHLDRRAESAFTATVVIPDRIAWRLFMKSINPDEARTQITFAGKKELAEHLLTLLAVMA